MNKALKKIDPFEGVLKTLGVLAGIEKVDRSEALNTDIGNIVVDTVIGYDTGTWETGIKKKDWIIVEQYPSKKSAIEGHNNWVKKIKKNPKMKFKSIDVWNF